MDLDNYCIAVKENIEQLNNSLKYMFFSISDSVMNSHI